jgi:hypothetical protein
MAEPNPEYPHPAVVQAPFPRGTRANPAIVVTTRHVVSGGDEGNRGTR